MTDSLDCYCCKWVALVGRGVHMWVVVHLSVEELKSIHGDSFATLLVVHKKWMVRHSSLAEVKVYWNMDFASCITWSWWSVLAA